MVLEKHQMHYLRRTQGYFTKPVTDVIQCLHMSYESDKPPDYGIFAKLAASHQESEQATILNRQSVVFMNLPDGRQCL